ncbi:MAG: xanthine dehydrogenase accessory protein XdhC [Pseudomonadaceae bacterium]|nr:xanthine dehydrogenase accessory protein XdhC [Pseudomonadaceae bacterium]
MTRWLTQLSEVQATLAPEQQAVMVTVARVRGSAPREVGARMWVTDSTTTGTVGGGELEYQCQAISRRILTDKSAESASLRNFPLGSNCGQCCGGVVDILFEKFSTIPATWQLHATETLAKGDSGFLTTQLSASDDKLSTGHKEFTTLDPGTCKNALVESIQPAVAAIAVFGAGHVGTALVNILSHTQYDVVCIDNRPEQLPLEATSNIQPVYQKQPATYVSSLAANTASVVMTHSHALDFDICAAMLKRDDLSFCGLIGSQSKRKRFDRLFRQAGLTDEQISRLICPVGDTDLTSKRPGEIAITIAAQILRHLEAVSQTQPADTVHAALHN